jgi:diguanylate cyclase (GGDEF)-like protein
LAGVLVFLGVFAVWSSKRGVNSASQLERSQLISSALSTARFATDEERLLEHKYLVGHGGDYRRATPGLHAKLDSISSRAMTALLALKRLGDQGDRQLAARLLATQQAYHAATNQVFAAARIGNASVARTQGLMADQSFNQLNSELADAAEDRSGDSLTRLNSLKLTERRIANVTVLTVPLALLLVGLFWLVLRAYRGRVQEYTTAERERLELEALVDSLTHLRNHRALQEDLDRILAQADRSGRAATLVLVDLDLLKQVNDTLGHPCGDERLRALAEAARRAARAGDSAYRIGGDEFAMILPDTRARDAFQLVQRLHAELSRLTGGRQTATAGIAEFGPGISRDQLIHNADLAMLEGKITRRDAVIYSSDLERADDGQPIDGVSLPMRPLCSALTHAVDAKDSLTRSHSETVATICVLIANELKLEPKRAAKLRVAGLLHDVGKIGVPDKDLSKPGPLTEEEWKVMRTHPVIGSGILLSAGLPDQAYWILHHHERIDGDGYPDRIAGEEIPLESRIILVADAFEAMTSDRPYRDGRTEREALEELERHAGTQFDDGCVQALRRALDRSGGHVPALGHSGSRIPALD